ncbi:MAG: efflux RND transporter permease subunit, partial [Planctomycetia bacterium]
MPGIGGFLFRPLTVAVGFAMLTSFVLSRTFVPMMCARFLPDEHLGQGMHREEKVTGILGWFQNLLELLTGCYLRLLDWSLAHRFLMMVMVGLIFAFSISLLPFL